MEVVRIEGGWHAGELIAELAKLPPDTPVWMSKDEEGNGFAPLAELGPAKVVPPAQPWMWTDEIHEPDAKRAPKKAIVCLVLWPGA